MKKWKRSAVVWALAVFALTGVAAPPANAVEEIDEERCAAMTSAMDSFTGWVTLNEGKDASATTRRYVLKGLAKVRRLVRNSDTEVKLDALEALARTSKTGQRDAWSKAYANIGQGKC
ncbi:MAG: hypothetical protein FJW97_10990 [Actinobacteria bacterium]|nr:hypothetical protein [Actinomycetota bacterium]